ncbi:MAG TPA: hypothetical protein VFN02_00150 [Ktedonobacteraceae bacterium]|nr:hypothetical protein [Ktedonobacteraceae bacterium]
MQMARAGATLLLHGRDETRGQQTLEEIHAQMGNTRLRWYRANFYLACACTSDGSTAGSSPTAAALGALGWPHRSLNQGQSIET